MPTQFYRIWGWADPVHMSTMGATRIGVAGIAKPASPAYPNQVVNEVVCMELGRAVRLPIPPGCVVRREDNKLLHYVSMDFSSGGEVLPPADARGIADEFPEMACGIILFDLWLANRDRNEANLSFDETSKVVQLFDHGRAFMCGINGRQRLETLDDKEVLKSNCLSEYVKSSVGFAKWNERIQQVPKYFIEEAISSAVALGLPDSDVDFCIDFLLSRRAKLLQLVENHKEVFTGIEPRLFSDSN